MNDELDILKEEEAVQEAKGWLSQTVFHDIEEQVFQRGSFTVVVIHAAAKNKQYEGVGFSKARQEVTISSYDQEKGKSVARGRAVHDLFQEFRKENFKK